jgi:hypothetical protein
MRVALGPRPSRPPLLSSEESGRDGRGPRERLVSSPRWVGWLVCVTLPLFTASSVVAAGGTLRGKLDPAAGVTAVTAIDRDTGKRYPAKLDAATGAFAVSDLPLAVVKKSADGETELTGGTYDLLVDYPGGRLEGVNLAVKRSDFEEEQPLKDADRKKLTELTKSLSKFEDVFEFLAVEGNVQHAVVFVSKLRTKEFYNSKPGEVTWRVEAMHYLRVRPEDPEDPWIKSPDELGILHYRERLQRADFDQKAIAFDPALGGLRLTNETPARDVGVVKLPPAKAGIRLRKAEGGR